MAGHRQRFTCAVLLLLGQPAGIVGRRPAQAQRLQPPALLVKEGWLPVLRGGARDGAGAEPKIAALLSEAIRDGQDRLRRGATDEEILDSLEVQVRTRKWLCSAPPLEGRSCMQRFPCRRLGWSLKTCAGGLTALHARLSGTSRLRTHPVPTTSRRHCGASSKATERLLPTGPVRPAAPPLNRTCWLAQGAACSAVSPSMRCLRNTSR